MKKKIFKNIILLLALVVISDVYALPAKVIGFRVSSLVARSRLVFDTTKPVIYSAFTLRKPDRLVIDLHDASANCVISRFLPSSSLLRDIRAGRHNNNVLRVVIDLQSPAAYKIFKLKRDGAQPDRLVVDVAALSKIKSKKPLVVRPKTVVKPVVAAKHVKLALKPKKKRDLIVLIDPGHGGKDSGAIGVRGTYEKNIVLAIARDLQKLINSQYGFHAYLTRTGDYFVPLRGRLRIERKYKPDMFIAIHADAYKNHTARGASVFALSQSGATSEAARWLAQKENESELGTTLAGLQYKSNMLRKVLINLAQTASVSESLGIGDDIIHRLAKVTRLHRGFVEQAAFVVLKEPDVPSLLVETGFLSNPNEEMELRSSKHQGAIAFALMSGIKSYFLQHPPRDSFIAPNNSV
ncbi:MAG: N-acetylmuramoyl-L-alanine amidase [Gammaproteobacteria bacterium]|nr:N-acetylmuramoyl-L-alanine amidase [Gammaproteobacteria bacterium]